MSMRASRGPLELVTLLPGYAWVAVSRSRAPDHTDDVRDRTRGVFGGMVRDAPHCGQI